MAASLRWAAVLTIAFLPGLAGATPPNGKDFLRLLGPRAQSTLEPRATTIGALFRVPSGFDPTSVGLRPFSPGFARLRASADDLLKFADAHPELPFEVAPPPHLLLDQVGQWTHAVAARQATGLDGTGALVGIVDTGIDFSLDDFNDASGHTRIAWYLDLTTLPSGQLPGLYPELELQFGGAVYAGSDITNLLGTGQLNGDTGPYLTDTVGHGTHVASIAAGNGGLAKKYVGIAPGAQLIVARITRSTADSLSTDDLLTGVQFAFNRADAMKKPIAVNLSIGSDFGSHDGTMAWEQAIASYVGPSQPGHALTVAAGNSGDITSLAVHETVYVPPGDSRSIPITSLYGGTAALGGGVQVWVTMRGGAHLSVGIDSPNGAWIAPVPPGQTGLYGALAGVANNTNGSGDASSLTQGQIASGSDSAIVLWGSEDWPKGTYSITLTAPPGGGGVADLYVEGEGDALDDNGYGIGFTYPVREGTVNIPATHPAAIAVGCTVNRSGWTSIAGGPVNVAISPTDPRGGYALDASTYSEPVPGNVCWFSSAGPTVTGVQKPEISAPGGIVIAAMSQWAGPDVPTSIFYNQDCPPVSDGGVVSPLCMQVDTTHAVAAGTSMSAPQAAGTIALLFQKDPTLTQDKIVGLLQAGAHFFRTGAPKYEDQGGPGELDVAGTLDAWEQAQDPLLALPSLATSWITLSTDELAANGSTPLTAIVELRTADGAHRADYFDATRLSPVVLLDKAPFDQLPALQRRAPGVWTFIIQPPPGLGGHTVTLGATFDGAPIVTAKTIPIATETWTANYPSSASGSGCSVSRLRSSEEDPALLLVPAVVFLFARARRRHSPAREMAHPWGSHR